MPSDFVPCGWRADISLYSHTDNEGHGPPPPYPGEPVADAAHMATLPPVHMSPPAGPFFADTIHMANLPPMHHPTPPGSCGPVAHVWSAAGQSMSFPTPIMMPLPMQVPQPPPPQLLTPLTDRAACPPYALPTRRYIVKKDKEKPKEPSIKKPDVHGGAKYLYPRDNVYIKVPSEGKKPWQLDSTTGFGFKVYKVGTCATVKELIEMLGGGKKHVLTECLEIGDGEWDKGLSIAYKDDEAKKPIADAGWTSQRDRTNPIWLCLHQKDD